MKQWCTKLSLSLQLMDNNTKITSSTKIFDTGFLPICKGIFQGDGWSPQWFCLALNPLSNILNNTKKGYKLNTSSDFNVSHLLYVDDLTIFAGNKTELQSLFETTAIFSSDIKMNFRLEKCATLEVKKGKITQQDNINLALSNYMLPTIESHYKYLGFLQDLVFNKAEVKEKISNGFTTRIKKVLSTSLTG